MMILTIIQTGQNHMPQMHRDLENAISFVELKTVINNLKAKKRMMPKINF